MADTKPTVFSIPVQRAFADALAAGLIARYADGALGLAQGLILLPSNRARSAVQAAFVRAGGTGLLMPRLAVIGDADLDESVALALDPIDESDAIPPAIETAMLARYGEATGRDIAHAYWALAAQRNTRILGVFVRLWKRDDKPHYKSFQPRMGGLLERDLAHPALVPVRQWFDANVPVSKRAEIWKAMGS